MSIINIHLLNDTYNIPLTSNKSYIIELSTKARKYYLAAEDDNVTNKWLAMFMELSTNSSNSNTNLNSQDSINLDAVNLDLDDIDGTRISTNGTVTGYLLKRPGRGGTWQRRYFRWVENTSIITYHASSNDISKIKGEINLKTCLSVKLSKANSEVTTGLVFELETSKRWWGLAATSDADMRWYRLIRDHVETLRASDLESYLPNHLGMNMEFNGKLYKKGKTSNSKWQLRYIRLTNKDTSLEWRKSNKINVSKAGSLKIKDIKSIHREPNIDKDDVVDGNKTENGERIYIFYLKMKTTSRKYQFGSPNQNALQNWIHELRTAMTNCSK